jgi:outer membrane protein, heavy metal efflux system
MLSRKQLQLASLSLWFAAAAATSGQQLRLDDLVSEALKNNPEILAAQKRYEAARQRPSQEGSLPDPMFSPGYTSSGNPLPGAQLGVSPTAAIGFMVTQEFPYPGKRGLRSAIAARDAEAEFQRYQETELSVVSRLKQAYYSLSYTYSASSVLDRNRSLLDKLLKITEARYSVGKAAQQDIFKTQTEISIIEGRLIELQRGHRAAVAEINSLLNRPPGQIVGQPAKLDPKEFIRSLDELAPGAPAEPRSKDN